jgi:hypothetical protein
MDNTTVVFQKDGEGNITGGGFSMENLFTSVPTIRVSGGGTSEDKLTNYFTSYAVPFGLATTSKGGFRKDSYQQEKSVKVMAQELHEKLLDLVREKKAKSEKSRKNRKALQKGKTKKSYE